MAKGLMQAAHVALDRADRVRDGAHLSAAIVADGYLRLARADRLAALRPMSCRRRC